MHTCLIKYLVCPACHGPLDWDVAERNEDRVESAQIRCQHCKADYFVRNGIGVFLLPDLPRNDLWEQGITELAGYLHDHPDVERKLMHSPMRQLSSADQFFRAMALEERGDYVAAKTVEEIAHSGLHTPEYLACLKSQVDFILDYLEGVNGPILDLASGRGYLVEKLAGQLEQPIIASDFSLRVLRRNHGWLESAGLIDRVSLLAFDVRQTPFKDGAIPYVTTNAGLSNVEEPGNLLDELKRIVSGDFLAIFHGYPEGDRANWEAIREVGLDERMLNLDAVLRLFDEADWQVEAANRCLGMARPTPSGVILEGARIDALPVVETTLEWCVLVAHGEK